MNTLNERPFSVSTIGKFIFTQKKWQYLLFISTSWLLLDLFSRELHAFTKDFASKSFVWSEHIAAATNTLLQPENTSARIQGYEAIKQDLLQSALTVFFGSVLPGIFITAILDFMSSAEYLSMVISPIHAIVSIPNPSGPRGHKFYFYAVRVLLQTFHNIGKSVPKSRSSCMANEIMPKRRTSFYSS